MIEQLGHFSSWIEIAVLAVMFYTILTFMRGTRGAGIVKGITFLFGVAFIGVMYLAEVLDLRHIREMLHWFLGWVALGLVVIFAPEIRRGLAHLAQTPLLSPLLRGPSTPVVDQLVEAAVKLSRNRIGAFVAIERNVGLGEYVENGVRLDAALSSELLEAIFYPGSALHDGAVILQHDRVAAAGCLLPLTDDPSLSKSMGTRHRAAIGISEESDAVALVVSEETGRISVIVDGKLTGELTGETLRAKLLDLLSRGEPPSPKKSDPAPGGKPA